MVASDRTSFLCMEKGLAIISGGGPGRVESLDIGLSHHRPDLPLAPWDSAKLGLGLWDSFTATVILELALFVTAWYFYVRATEAQSKGGKISLWSWTIFVVVIYFTSLLGPPPPNETALAYGGLAAWLFVPWGYWIDKQRTMKNAASPS